ncbi:MAG: hypothetical protein M0R22_09845 [Dehalococcoidia bacterium]|nr:hypothetical protein [Dehalococcoidia bacterium]
MGFSYLGGKNWLDVTREERLFCAHLYHDIRSGRREQEFVRWLRDARFWWVKPAPESLNVNQDWEVAYEVCFYRDLLKSRNQSAKLKGFPQKRTFDLCLFSEKCIVIFEAKVHEGFDTEQMSHLTTYGDEQQQDADGDRQMVRALAGGADGPVVLTVALASSKYLEKRHKGSGDVLKADRVDAVTSWKDVHEWARRSVVGYAGIYSTADEKYGS